MALCFYGLHVGDVYSHNSRRIKPRGLMQQKLLDLLKPGSRALALLNMSPKPNDLAISSISGAVTHGKLSVETVWRR